MCIYVYVCVCVYVCTVLISSNSYDIAGSACIYIYIYIYIYILISRSGEAGCLFRRLCGPVPFAPARSRFFVCRLLSLSGSAAMVALVVGSLRESTLTSTEKCTPLVSPCTAISSRIASLVQVNLVYLCVL